MPDFYIRAEPIFSEESVEQYMKRICNKQAAELASEKRIWERKKLAEINKAKIELANISEHMKTNDEKWVVSEHIRRWASSLRKTLEAFNPELNTFNQPTVMKNETITIEAPEGHVIDKENSTDTVIRFKKVEPNKRPMSWGDIERINGYYINSDSEICDIDGGISAHYKNRNVWTTNKLAEAALALSQLLQLRDAWNECNTEEQDRSVFRYCIFNSSDAPLATIRLTDNIPLRFKTEETRDAFLKQFRPLIETALPLL